MTVRVTKHAKARAKERLDLSYKSERTKNFSKALKYGHPIADFSGEFQEYLLNRKKYKHTGVKVYNDNVYIYNNKTIITVFPVPDKYLPVKDNFCAYVNQNHYLVKLYKYVDKDSVAIDVILKDKTGVTVGLFIEDHFENYGIGTTEIKAKNNAIKAYLKRIGKFEEDNDEKK